MIDSTTSSKDFLNAIGTGRRLNRVITGTVIAMLLLFVYAVAASAPVTSPDFFQFMGRFHPMILHFPIGFLLGLFLIEVYIYFRPSRELEPAAWILLLMGTVSAIVASLLGLFLSWGSTAYGAELLSDHKWMGFSVAGLALVSLTYKWHYRKNPKKSLLNAYRCSLLLCVVLLGMAGHHGGSLSHGEGYLTKFMPNWMKNLTGVPIAVTGLGENYYLQEIQPILEGNCYKCHGDSKQEGDMRLDQPHHFATLTGESEVPTIVAGDAIASGLVRSITYHKDHDDVMPPSDKEPLDPKDVLKLISWIDKGAPIGNVVVPKKSTGEFATKIWPILKDRCISCHGPKSAKKKKNPKGGLRLDTAKWILRGVVDDDEEDQAVIIPGKPDKSSFYTLTTLDENDDDIMPAKGKPLTKEQQKAIFDWIKNGAKFEGWEASNVKKTSALQGISPAHLAKVRSTGALVLPVAENHAGLTVNFLNVHDQVKDSDLAALKDLNSHIVWLNLSSSQIGSEGLKHLSNLKELEHLNLSKTKIQDADLIHLKALNKLTYLNLYGTDITDKGLVHLSGHSQLKKLFLWQSKATDKGVENLRGLLKNTEVDFGFKDNKPKLLADGKVSYQNDIMPIFKDRCIGCHGPKSAKKKKNPKGGLRLDTPEWIKRGSVEEGEKDEAIYVAGKPDKSSLYESIILPEDHDDIMPAKGKPLTKKQIALIKNWIAEGAHFDKAGAGSAHTKVVIKLQLIDKLGKDVSPAPAQALATIRKLGVSLETLSQRNHLLQLSFVSVKAKTDDASLKGLGTLSGHLTWLNLSGSKISNAGLKHLAPLSKLNRLNLSNTKITDGGLSQISGLSNLEYLNLYNCQVSDLGMVHLKKLKNLKKLFLWGSKVSKAGAANLKKSLPEVTIDLGADDFLKIVERIKKEKVAKDKAAKDKAAKDKAAKANPLAKFFDAGSCCDKAHKKNAACKHGCCVKAAKAKTVCAKCNAKGAAKFKAQPKTPKNPFAPYFDAGSCCDKAHKKGGACKHGCCVKATKAKTVCAKCNATGAAKFKKDKK
jgi:uncharacterized membrane protein/mono/diheme cytochrome c family protein